MQHWKFSAICAAICVAVVGAAADAAASAAATTIAQQGEALVAELGLHEAAARIDGRPQWRKPGRIVVLVDTAERAAWLRTAIEGSGATLVGANNLRELKELVVDADAMVGPCNAEVLTAGTRLQWVQIGNVGVERCLALPALRDGRVVLSNMQGVGAATIAEHAMGLVLALARQLGPFMQDQREGRWNNGPFAPLLTLEGKTMLVVGLGNIGSRIAQRASAFGMRVIAVRNGSGERPAYVSYVGLAAELAMLAAEADVVVNATPLTRDTAGMFNARVFARMRPTALFVNIGRGGSVVTDDLVNALKAGKIAGAGLDVVDPEPLPAAHPLRKMSNVIVTPHVAGDSDTSSDQLWLVIRENLRRYVAGGRLLSVIDPARGY